MNNFGLNRESNHLAPQARIIPLDHWATFQFKLYFYQVEIDMNMQRKGDEGYNI